MNYPKAKTWMWSYCMYLGEYTDSKGRHYDLGIHCDRHDGSICAAIVGSNRPGDYWSGDFPRHSGEVETRDFYIETAKRAESKGFTLGVHSTANIELFDKLRSQELQFTKTEVMELLAKAHDHGYRLCMGSSDDALEFEDWVLKLWE